MRTNVQKYQQWNIRGEGGGDNKNQTDKQASWSYFNTVATATNYRQTITKTNKNGSKTDLGGKRKAYPTGSSERWGFAEAFYQKGKYNCQEG